MSTENNTENNKEETVGCPVGKFFSDLDRVFGKKSKFLEHMTQSRIEFLKGIKSLVEEHIDDLEKRHSRRSGKSAKKMRNIRVE